MDLQEIKKWVDTFYQGSNTQGNVEVKAFNEKYTLCYIKGHSGYVGRISGSLYSPSEWLVFETLAKTERGVFGSAPKSLFRFEGRLTKEHKSKLKQDFNLTLLEVPKKEKIINDSDIYIIAINDDAFWSRGFNSAIMCYKLLKEEESVYIIKGTNQNIRLNKNKYKTLKVTEAEKDAKLSEISLMIKDYQSKLNVLDNLKYSICDKFKKNN